MYWKKEYIEQKISILDGYLMVIQSNIYNLSKHWEIVLLLWDK